MIELKRIDGRLSLDDGASRVHIDFDDIDFRLIKKSAHNTNQPVVKALGKATETVVDLTCGFAKDTYLFLCTGRRVIGVERNSMIYELLKNAVERGQSETEHLEVLSRFGLVYGEARNFVETLSEASFPDAFYIDPMYPPRNTSALPRKEIQMLRKLLHKDLEEDPIRKEADLNELIQLCLTKVKRRVVLKRPTWLEPQLPPKVSFEGKMVRYDVYVRE